jgi:hypothetical protein
MQIQATSLLVRAGRGLRACSAQRLKLRITITALRRQVGDEERWKTNTTPSSGDFDCP